MSACQHDVCVSVCSQLVIDLIMNGVKCTISTATVLTVEPSSTVAHDAPGIGPKRADDGFRKRSYVIEKELLHTTDDGTHFLLLSRNHYTSRRIMRMQAHDHHGRGDDNLRMCDIPKRLVKARDLALRLCLTRG